MASSRDGLNPLHVHHQIRSMNALNLAGSDSKSAKIESIAVDSFFKSWEDRKHDPSPWQVRKQEGAAVQSLTVLKAQHLQSKGLQNSHPPELQPLNMSSGAAEGPPATKKAKPYHPDRPDPVTGRMKGEAATLPAAEEDEEMAEMRDNAVTYASGSQSLPTGETQSQRSARQYYTTMQSIRFG